MIRMPISLSLLIALVSATVLPAAPTPLSPCDLAISSDHQTVYVAAATGNQVLAVDPAGKRAVRSIPLPGAPGALTLTPDNATLYVSLPQPEGKVLALDPATGKVKKTFSAGHYTDALALSPDGTALAVCNRFEDTVSILNLPDGKERKRIRVSREPSAVAFTRDGSLLLVANHLPRGPANGAYIAGGVSLIDPAAGQVVGTVDFPNGSHSLMDIAISPDGKFAYVTHILSRYAMPTTQLERGWMNTNALTLIDLAARKRLNTVLLDQIGRGAANPWGVSCSPDGRWVAVALAGTHEVSLIDRTGLHDKLDRAARGEQVSAATRTVDDIPNDLAFLVDLHRRMRMPEARGPRAVAWLGESLAAATYFSDTLEMIDQPAAERPRYRTVALGPTPQPDQVRHGELLFFDADQCFQQWQSCVSCHPGVRVDGLNWDLLNDGIGNPKNTKSMLLAHQTPPAMITGIRDSAEVAVRAGLRHIQFAVRPEEEAQAIDAYLKSLTPVPSPYLVKGKLSPSAQRGKKVFGEIGCAVCHPAPLYTDLESYDVDTGVGRHEGQAFDTPTLIESWRTAPYLHDGRAATMTDLLEKERHGVAPDLDPKKLKDLIEYANSL